ncbi:MAG: PAS domain S-box protein [Calditrichaeota bacterium]|nr:PAS domain S-box protein [Calditrichota bacterium]
MNRTSSKRRGSPPSGRPLILVVEDDRELLDFLVEFLQFRGYDCATASDGSGALKILAKRDVNLLITDLEMPGVGGIELLRRANQMHRDLPKIVLSGRGRFEDAVEVVRTSAFYYFAKPIQDFEEFDRIIRLALERDREVRLLNMTADQLAAAKSHHQEQLTQQEHHTEEYRTHFHTLLENGRDAIFICNSEWVILEANQNAANLFNLTRREMERLQICGDATPTHLTDLCRQLHEASRQPGEFHFATTTTRRDGTDIDLEVIGVPVAASDPPRLVIYLRDVSDFQRRYRHLKQRIEHLEDMLQNRRLSQQPDVGPLMSMLDAANVLIFVTDPHGTIIEWNRTASRLTGLSQREACQPGALEKIIIDFPRVLEPLFRQEVLELGRDIENVETDIRTADGEVISIRWNIAPVHLGSVIGALAVGVEVSSEKELRRVMKAYTDQLEMVASERTRELLQSQERYRHLFEHVRDAIFAATDDGRLVEVNPAWQRLLGYPARADVLGRHFLRDFAANSSEAERLMSLLAVRTLLQDEPIQLRRRDGSLLTVMITVSVQPGMMPDSPSFEGVIRDITQLKELEQKLVLYSRDLEQMVRDRSRQLALSEAKLRRLMETSPDLIYRIDIPTMRFDIVSPAVETITGYTVRQMEEIGPDGFISSLHPDDSGALLDHWSSFNRKSRLDRDELSLEYRFRRADGEVVWLSDHGTVVRDDLGEVAAIEGVIRDITVEKQAAEQLTRQAEMLEDEVARRTSDLVESESRYRMLLAEAGDIIFTCDAAGLISEMNRRGEELLGQRVEELNEANFTELLDETSRRRFRRALRTCFQHGFKPVPFQIEYRTPRGNRLFLEIQSSPVVIGGQVAMALNVARDLTARRHAANTIRSLKEFNEGIIRSMSEGIFIEDEDGRCQFVNPAMSEMLGMKEKQMVGKMGIDLVAPHDRTLIQNQTELRRLRGFNRYEARLIGADGEEVPVMISSRSRFKGSKPNGALAVVSDLRNLKEMERRQRFMENLLADERKLADIGMLAAGIAHNIASPLMVISGYVQMLRSRLPELRELDAVLSQIDKIDEITRNMMAKSRSEQDKHLRSIDVNELLQTELKFLEANLHFKSDVAKEYHFDPLVPRVQAVYSDLSQTFSNIINNAMDAMHDQVEPRLIVSTSRVGSMIEISFADNGRGIPPEIVERIFDPFFTTKPPVGSVQGDEPSGTGLGLSTAQQMISQYGGRIEVDSVPGIGSTFKVILPVAPEDLERESKGGFDLDDPESSTEPGVMRARSRPRGQRPPIRAPFPRPFAPQDKRRP